MLSWKSFFELNEIEINFSTNYVMFINYIIVMFLKGFKFIKTFPVPLATKTFSPQKILKASLHSYVVLKAPRSRRSIVFKIRNCAMLFSQD